MTAKEKAKELVRKYSCYLHGIDENVNFDVVIHDEAKSLAFIVVDDLIKQEKSLLGLSDKYESTWYNMVKDEIEKL
jgi:hypothetical protein